MTARYDWLGLLDSQGTAPCFMPTVKRSNFDSVTVEGRGLQKNSTCRRPQVINDADLTTRLQRLGNSRASGNRLELEAAIDDLLKARMCKAHRSMLQHGSLPENLRWWPGFLAGTLLSLPTPPHYQLLPLSSQKRKRDEISSPHRNVRPNLLSGAQVVPHDNSTKSRLQVGSVSGFDQHDLEGTLQEGSQTAHTKELTSGSETAASNQFDDFQLPDMGDFGWTLDQDGAVASSGTLAQSVGIASSVRTLDSVSKQYCRILLTFCPSNDTV